MFIELGNTSPKSADGSVVDLGCPVVTRVHVPDSYSFDPSLDVEALRSHLRDADDFSEGITNFEGAEAVISIVHPSGAWRNHSSARPTWVSCDNEDFQHVLAAFYNCPEGKPSDVEATHYTTSGPPGIFPGDAVNAQMLLVNSGRDMFATRMAGGVPQASAVSTTAPTATTYTLDTIGAPGGTAVWNGQRIFAGSTSVGLVWANIISNTNVSPPVLTIDRWYISGTPGGAAATTPVAGPWGIGDGGGPAWFMGITANATASSATDTSLTAEIVTASGGLIRKICPWAHSAGTNTYTLTPVFTANASDTLPVTVAKAATFNSMVVANVTSTMMFETLLNATATLSAIGDTLTVTQTVTTS